MVFWPGRDGAGPGWFPGKFAPSHRTQAARALSSTLPAPARRWSLPLRSLAIVATANSSGLISLGGMLDPRGKHSRYPPIRAVVSERA